MKESKTIDSMSLRKDFPILDQKVHGQPLIYFDNAAT
jgi:cysteine desulfurase/selenocysteine lyase